MDNTENQEQQEPVVDAPAPASPAAEAVAKEAPVPASPDSDGRQEPAFSHHPHLAQGGGGDASPERYDSGEDIENGGPPTRPIPPNLSPSNVSRVARAIPPMEARGGVGARMAPAQQEDEEAEEGEEEVFRPFPSSRIVTAPIGGMELGLNGATAPGEHDATGPEEGGRTISPVANKRLKKLPPRQQQPYGQQRVYGPPALHQISDDGGVQGREFAGLERAIVEEDENDENNDNEESGSLERLTEVGDGRLVFVADFPFHPKNYATPHEPGRKKLYSRAVRDKEGCVWRLMVFPFGNDYNTTGNVSAFLELVNAKALQAGCRGGERWHRRVEFDLALLDRFDIAQSKEKDMLAHDFTATNSDYGYPRCWERKELKGNPALLWPGGTFRLAVRVTDISPAGSAVGGRGGLSTLDRNRETGMVGLKNQGATCYMNSLLQTLFHLHSLRKAVYDIPTAGEDAATSVPLALQKVFWRLQTGQPTSESNESNESIESIESKGNGVAKASHIGPPRPVGTKELTKSFGWDTYDSFLQQDVQELNRVLCDKLEEKMKGTKADGAIERLFGGRLRSYIRCVDVDYESKREETYYDIQLDVKGCRNIHQSFAKYTEEELMDGDNEYDAGHFGKQAAKKGVKFLEFPPVLNIHLKRFEFDMATGNMVKVNDKFEFPETLDIDEYLATHQEPSLAGAAAAAAAAAAAPGVAPTAAPQRYRLHSVLVHSGELHGGHYFAFIRPQISNVSGDSGDSTRDDAKDDDVVEEEEEEEKKKKKKKNKEEEEAEEDDEEEKGKRESETGGESNGEGSSSEEEGGEEGEEGGEGGQDDDGDRWFKFDDEHVTNVSFEEAVRGSFGWSEEDDNRNRDFHPENFFGVSHRLRSAKKGGKRGKKRRRGQSGAKEGLLSSTPNCRPSFASRYSSAYMLVYVRETDWAEVMLPLPGFKGVPEALRLRFQGEEAEAARIAKDKREAHLFFFAQLATDQDIRDCEPDGQAISEDFVRWPKVRRLKVRRSWRLQELVDAVAQELSLNSEHMRLWSVITRENKTVRPDNPLQEEEEGEEEEEEESEERDGDEGKKWGVARNATAEEILDMGGARLGDNGTEQPPRLYVQVVHPSTEKEGEGGDDGRTGERRQHECREARETGEAGGGEKRGAEAAEGSRAETGREGGEAKMEVEAGEGEEERALPLRVRARPKCPPPARRGDLFLFVKVFRARQQQQLVTQQGEEGAGNGTSHGGGSSPDTSAQALLEPYRGLTTLTATLDFIGCASISRGAKLINLLPELRGRLGLPDTQQLELWDGVLIHEPTLLDLDKTGKAQELCCGDIICVQVVVPPTEEEEHKNGGVGGVREGEEAGAEAGEGEGEGVQGGGGDGTIGKKRPRQEDQPRTHTHRRPRSSHSHSHSHHWCQDSLGVWRKASPLNLLAYCKYRARRRVLHVVPSSGVDCLHLPLLPAGASVLSGEGQQPSGISMEIKVAHSYRTIVEDLCELLTNVPSPLHIKLTAWPPAKASTCSISDTGYNSNSNSRRLDGFAARINPNFMSNPYGRNDADVLDIDAAHFTNRHFECQKGIPIWVQFTVLPFSLLDTEIARSGDGRYGSKPRLVQMQLVDELLLNKREAALEADAFGRRLLDKRREARQLREIKEALLAAAAAAAAAAGTGQAGVPTIGPGKGGEGGGDGPSAGGGDGAAAAVGGAVVARPEPVYDEAELSRFIGVIYLRTESHQARVEEVLKGAGQQLGIGEGEEGGSAPALRLVEVVGHAVTRCFLPDEECGQLPASCWSAEVQSDGFMLLEREDSEEALLPQSPGCPWMSVQLVFSEPEGEGGIGGGGRRRAGSRNGSLGTSGDSYDTPYPRSVHMAYGGGGFKSEPLHGVPFLTFLRQGEGPQALIQRFLGRRGVAGVDVEALHSARVGIRKGDVNFFYGEEDEEGEGAGGTGRYSNGFVGSRLRMGVEKDEEEEEEDEAKMRGREDEEEEKVDSSSNGVYGRVNGHDEADDASAAAATAAAAAAASSEGMELPSPCGEGGEEGGREQMQVQHKTSDGKEMKNEKEGGGNTSSEEEQAEQAVGAWLWAELMERVPECAGVRVDSRNVFDLGQRLWQPPMVVLEVPVGKVGGGTLGAGQQKERRKGGRGNGAAGGSKLKRGGRRMEMGIKIRG